MHDPSSGLRFLAFTHMALYADTRPCFQQMVRCPIFDFDFRLLLRWLSLSERTIMVRLSISDMIFDCYSCGFLLKRATSINA